jgi:organic radical activating enzyme
MEDLKLKVSELFYSIQGEGARVGSANIFIRLQGCKAKSACFALGVMCDTEFESGTEMTVVELLAKVKQIGGGCKDIIWTGGEPAQQITEEICAIFADNGYYQCIETSGLFPVPKGIDYICISPKVAEHVIEKNFKDTNVQELRYVRHSGQSIPMPAISADSYFISPHSDGFDINAENVKHCINLVKQNPTWRISIQMHKIFTIL